MNKDREKQNYNIETPYISGTPMKKDKNRPNLVEVHF
jgi:hypothetical protein